MLKSRELSYKTDALEQASDDYRLKRVVEYMNKMLRNYIKNQVNMARICD